MQHKPNAAGAAAIVGALGVVYGDIGTSPLYALRECFSGSHGIAPEPANVLGVVSLMFWSLTLIVSIKYLALVMQVNNRGEGGILVLLSLALRNRKHDKTLVFRTLFVLGVTGAALLYGDGMITPAVTVLGAVEGLELATPIFKPYVIPIAVAVLVGLFSMQRLGTGKVGSFFGPIMVLWFGSLAVMGLAGVMRSPLILQSLNPIEAISFLANNRHTGFVVLGSVFLAVTGAEALYADMGHFGTGPIRKAWFSMVYPSLVLNYLGQGALLLRDPGAAKNPFFLLAPQWGLVPLALLATAAAVIASQALIAGAYSLSMQAIQMGLVPRLIIRHTSRASRGQIYMPQVNGFLMLACITLVLTFGSSSNLAGAYGIAVSLTMLVTTTLFTAAAMRTWNWHPALIAMACGIFGLIELAFVGANALKITQGGWFPLVIGAWILLVMLTWHRGRQTLRARLSESYLPFDEFLQDAANYAVTRVPGTAVFLSGNPGGTPIALLHNLRHNKVLHRRIVVLTIITSDAPAVPDEERVQLEQMSEDVWRVVGRYGFMEQPNIPALLTACGPLGLEINQTQTTYFVSRETIIPKSGPGMAGWRRRLFAALSRNAQPVTAFFQLTPNRVVELGMQIEV